MAKCGWKFDSPTIDEKQKRGYIKIDKKAIYQKNKFISQACEPIFLFVWLFLTYLSKN